jgi:hypothetical protein
MYAHNNEEIDYIKIATANALMVKHNLGVPVTLVSDASTVRWGRESLPLFDKALDTVIAHDRDWVYQQQNLRVFRDTTHNFKKLPFYNCDHWEAYKLSPYTETLFIDADYLIMSDTLSKCWGSKHDFLINSDFEEFVPEKRSENKRVDPFSIKLYWATAIYFRKGDLANAIFTLAKHVFDEYRYYRDLYQLPEGMFRNDFAFSIAVHMLNGMKENNMGINRLPQPVLYKLFDKDDIYKVKGINDLLVYMEQPEKPGTFILGRVRDTDLHVMNKWAINRVSDDLIQLYGDTNE